MFQDSQVVVYNQSKHATNSVLADIRAVWGSRVRVIQTLEVPWDPIQTQVHPDFIFISGRRFSIYSDIFYIFIWVILRFSHHITDKISGYLLVVSPFAQEGNQRLPGMDAALYVRPKSWGDLDHFKERLDFMCTQEREGWWRMVKDGEGWWRMVKGHRFIGPSIYVYIYIYVSTIYQHISTYCWMLDDIYWLYWRIYWMMNHMKLIFWGWCWDSIAKRLPLSSHRMSRSDRRKSNCHPLQL